MKIVEGRVYRYIGNHPPDCEGHLYRVVGFAKDLPSYQEKVIVIGLTGPDKGVYHTCSQMTFAMRFRSAAPLEQVEQLVVTTDTTVPVGPCYDLSEKGAGW